MSTELTKSQKLALELTMGLSILYCSLGKNGEIISNTKENGVKIYDKSLFDYSDYLRIKHEFIGSISSYPYNWKVELEEGLEVVKKYEFRYNSNSCSWEFDRISQKHWMEGFSEKEREKIKKILDTRQENSQKLKKEILNNFPSWEWGIRLSWICNIREKIYLHDGIKERAGSFRYRDGWSGKELSREDYQEVRNAVVKNIVNQFKQNPHEWRIQNVCIFNGDLPDFKYMGGYQEWKEKVIHHSIPFQYGWEWKYDFEKHKRKVFEREIFNNEEWAEIEKLLKGSKSPISNKNNDIELEKIKKIFQAHHINKITFENGQLFIEYYNNQKAVNDSEKQALEKYCQEHNEKEINRQKLGISSDNVSPSLNNLKPNNHHLAIFLFGGTLLVAVLVVAIGLVVKKRKAKINY